MKKYFPFSTSYTEKVWCLDIPFTEVHPFFIEIQHFYPYHALLDRNGGRIAFFNRNYKVISKREEGQDCWFKIDIQNFKCDNTKIKFERFENVDCEVYDFYETTINNWFDLIEFVRKLSYVESLLLEDPPFLQRFALTIKKAYHLKNENDRLKREIEKLKELNKQLKDACRENFRR